MGQPQEAIASLGQGLSAYAKAGAAWSWSAFTSWLVEAHLIAGQAEDGLKALAEAFDHVNETGERFWEAELYRLNGELLLLPGGSEAEAEARFNQALGVAGSQGAKSLEMRSTISLARSWQKTRARWQRPESCCPGYTAGSPRGLIHLT